MAAGVISLLVLVGTPTATLVASWLLPAFIALSVLLLGRSFYILYVQKRGTRFSTAVTWLTAAFVVGYWTWRLTTVATACPEY
jgi:hypothetical protein